MGRPGPQRHFPQELEGRKRPGLEGAVLEAENWARAVSGERPGLCQFRTCLPELRSAGKEGLGTWDTK